MAKAFSHGSKRFRNSTWLSRWGIAFSTLAIALGGVTVRLRAEPSPSPDPSGPVAERQLFALGMIESGNDDWGVGAAGEVSRYQIQPSVWKAYSKSRNFQHPELARSVASQHWSYLVSYFRKKTGRDPSDFDMYVLWSTRYGYYANRSFNPDRIDLTVRDRARRFVNLVNR